MGSNIKLKGSSFWDRRKPINKKRKMRDAVRSIDSFSKRRPVNKPTRIKNSISRDNTRTFNSSRSLSGNRYLPDIIEKRYLFIIFIIVILFTGIGVRLFQLQVIMNEEYSKDLVHATEKIVKGESAPRGRIYDRNYKLIVDNKAVKTIYYKKESGITTKDEIEAYDFTVGYPEKLVFNLDGEAPEEEEKKDAA